MNHASVLMTVNLSINVKRQAAQGYVLSCGLYNAATWPRLRKGEMQAFHSGVMRIYRHIVNNKDGDCISDKHVLEYVKAIAPINAIRLLRLHLLIKLVQGQHDRLLCLLFAARNYKRSWLAAVIGDLVFLVKVSCKFSELNNKPLSSHGLLCLGSRPAAVGKPSTMCWCP